MNKDVIYIDPEDDITDIITKIENSKEKIVALVPPKKAGVFRSVVNIKLIAKSGVNAGKTIVLVTTDPAITKLAGSTKLPVTKDLKSAPSIPKVDEVADAEPASADEILESAAKESEEEVVEDVEDEAKDKKSDDKKDDDDEKKEEKDDEKSDKKDKKPVKSKNPFINWVKNHKVLISILAGLVVVFGVVLFWAFAIAPSASVTVAIRTTTTNFSENATFVTKLADENVTSGKFYLDEKKSEVKTESTFEATGTKNIGEKATGDLVVYAYFRNSGNVAVNAGATFTYGNLKFTADKDVTLSWDGKDVDACENKGTTSSITSGCLISSRVNVTAVEPGTQYNIAAASSGWTTTANVGVYSDQAMSGGTSKTVRVVQQSDIDTALAKVKENNSTAQEARKAKLISEIDDGAFIIESSYKQTTGEPTSKPALGEEVGEDGKATLSVTTTDSIYIIDKTKVEQFITEKAKITDDYKIYQMNDPFIENFTDAGDDTYIGKIKTSFVSGPKVTENDIIDTIKGKGLGQARADLLDAFSGIDSNNTRIEVPYFWVFSVPNNPEKITVKINVEE